MPRRLAAKGDLAVILLASVTSSAFSAMIPLEMRSPTITDNAGPTAWRAQNKQRRAAGWSRHPLPRPRAPADRGQEHPRPV